MIPNRILIEWEGKKWSAKTNLLLRLHGPLDSIMNSPVSWLISKRPDQGRILSLDMYESSSTSRRGIRLKPLHTPCLLTPQSGFYKILWWFIMLENFFSFRWFVFHSEMWTCFNQAWNCKWVLIVGSLSHCWESSVGNASLNWWLSKTIKWWSSVW